MLLTNDRRLARRPGSRIAFALYAQPNGPLDAAAWTAAVAAADDSADDSGSGATSAAGGPGAWGFKPLADGQYAFTSTRINRGFLIPFVPSTVRI